jgi:hypothetical protein
MADARAAKARNPRRNSLRKQREAQKELIAPVDACSVSGINRPVEIAKLREPMHRQAVLVTFATQVQFHQSCLGGPCVTNSQEFRSSTGNVHCLVLLAGHIEIVSVLDC